MDLIQSLAQYYVNFLYLKKWKIIFYVEIYFTSLSLKQLLTTETPFKLPYSWWCTIVLKRRKTPDIDDVERVVASQRMTDTSSEWIAGQGTDQVDVCCIHLYKQAFTYIWATKS